jgi:DNA-binding winged helix-turn-helix (wHTH) protein
MSIIDDREKDSNDPGPSLRLNRLRFDCFVIDLNRGCLIHNENEIALRPKTFKVLQFLVENCGRLVSKDELFAAVWPDIAVTDDTLVQSIGELRRALGEEGPRLIRTVPRRGYRFEALISVEPCPVATEPTATTFGEVHEANLFATALSNGRRQLFAVLALVTLLVPAALWAGFGSGWRSGERALIAPAAHGTGSRDAGWVCIHPVLRIRDRTYCPRRQNRFYLGNID